MKQTKRSLILGIVLLLLALFALPVSAKAAVPAVTYRADVQSKGWQAWKKSGATAGITGKSLRLERLQVKKPAGSGSISYRVIVGGKGWQDWKSNGASVGTDGKRMEAVQIKLTGTLAKQYDVYYRVYAQKNGWLGWAKNGQTAGTSGYTRRLEGIQIKLVKKGGTAPGKTTGRFAQLKNENVKTSLLNRARAIKNTSGMKAQGVYVDIDNNKFSELIWFAGMDIYVIGYDRAAGKTVIIKKFDKSSGKGGGLFAYYNADNHLVGYSTDSTGGFVFYMYKLSGTKLTTAYTAEYINARHSSTGSPVYKINGKKVSKSTFKSKINGSKLSQIYYSFGYSALKISSYQLKW